MISWKERAALYERTLRDELHDPDDERYELSLDDYRHVLVIDPQNQVALESVERLAPSSAPHP